MGCFEQGGVGGCFGAQGLCLWWQGCPPARQGDAFPKGLFDGKVRVGFGAWGLP